MSEPSDKTPTSFIGSPSPPPTPSKYSIMAVISLSLSCLSLVIGPIGYIPGIIFGHAARSECKKNPQLVGSRMALAGLIIGYLCLFLTIAVVVLILNYLKFSFKSFVVTDPDAFDRMLEELRRFFSTTKTV
jgi:hypothetical protein